MTCSGRYASAAEYVNLMCSDSDLTDPAVVTEIEGYLDLAAADVHAALASVNLCNATLATWALTYLKKLNILDAAVIQNCPCGNTLTTEQKQMFLTWLGSQFELIRMGKVELVDNETGTDYPAVGVVQQGWTEWNNVDMIINRLLVP